jgi:hypothetical protein
MTKPTEQAIESLAKEMLDDQITLGIRPGAPWKTASKVTKAAYLNYARLVLEGSNRR